MELLIILAVPLVFSLLGVISNSHKVQAKLIFLAYLLNLIFSISLAYRFLISQQPLSLFNIFYADSLSIFFIFTVSIVSFAAAIYSKGYIEHELAAKLIVPQATRYYYLLFNLFIFSMLLTIMVNNLGLMWVAIELTTLVSAFLVGFHNSRNSVEAAWKYLIICSVGIILALLGTIIFSYAFFLSSGVKSLNWTELVVTAKNLNPDLVRIAFIFILVGYGTKAGLAPMHTWLPDAHSQALSPVSALLSGVLLKTSVYAILRYSVIANLCLGSAFSSRLFIFFGVLSLVVSAGLVLVQKDIKRLLAYSSIEHIGIIMLGFGLGGIMGTYGALLHIFNHAATKSLLFFGAGNLVNAYGTNKIRSIRGALKVLPFSGFMVLIGIFALSGFPPFSMFFSELMILASAFSQGHYLLGGFILLVLSLVFSAVLYQFGKMLFGEKPKHQPAVKEAFSSCLAFIFLLAFILVGWGGLVNSLIRSVLLTLKGL